ncbi:ankyrin repeat domain-containing protein [Arcobacter sp.]|uniref:ankyrin repeat domain-containing protein n=1 Tax=Arcobacter sp. TaxID=1872629 RepID=UPI003C74A50B
MKCPHCNKEGLSLLDVNTFSKKEKIITCRVCNKQSYFPNLTINEENPFLYTIIIILLVVSFFSPYPVNIVLLTILLIIAVSMLFTKKVYPFNTEEELNILKKSFLPLEKTEDTRLKDYPEALKYYKNNNAFELAIFYEETLKDYEEAILWYEKAYTQGNQDSLNIIGLIYKNKLNDYDKAKEYFIKSIKIGNIDSIQNIALFYYSVLKDKVTASAYYIALIDAKYSKDEVLKLLKEELNIDENSIKEGYELQLTIPELPRKYKGKLDLNENTKKDYIIDSKYNYYIKKKPSKSDLNKKNKIISLLLILVIAISSFVVYKYDYSYDKELDNYPEAKRLYENRDDANSTFELALFYLNLDKKEKAIYWFKKSVDQENPMAAIRLAYVEENKKEYWFDKAFKLGFDPFSLYKVDIKNSSKWLNVAYDMGNCEAVKIKIEEYKKTYINTVKDSFSPIFLASAEKEFGEHLASYRRFYYSGCKELANDIGKLYLINQTSYLRNLPQRGIDTMTYLDNIYRNINSSRKENIKEAEKWFKKDAKNKNIVSENEISNIDKKAYKNKENNTDEKVVNTTKKIEKTNSNNKPNIDYYGITNKDVTAYYNKIRGNNPYLDKSSDLYDSTQDPKSRFYNNKFVKKYIYFKRKYKNNPKEKVDEIGYSKLMNAIDDKKYIRVKVLLENGANINHYSPDGRTPLIRAIFSKDLKIFDLLLKYKPELNLVTSNIMKEPILIAFDFEQYKMVEKLIDAGADINVTDYHNDTLLHLSVYYYSRTSNSIFLNIVKKLLSKNIDITIKNDNGYTALDIAKLQNNEYLKKILEDYQHQLNSSDLKNKEEKKDIKLTSKKPTALKEVIEMNIKLKNSWENANKDPEEAIKVGYAYAKYKNDYNNAILWYKYSDNIKSLPKTSNLICYSYQQLKEYNEALKWCKKAIDLGSTKALFQIATTYFNLNEYNNALKYFLESSKMGNTSELNLGLVYSKLKNFKESEKWYKKAIEKKNMEAFKHISYFYHEDLKDDIKASAYFLSIINTVYVKSSVLDFLQNDWKIPNETIKKGYELQLNSDEFPIKYKGKLDLE